MQALIEEAVRVYAEAGLDCGDFLLPPATEEEIRQVEFATKQPIHPDLLALWCVHGGQEYFASGNRGLFGRHRLLTPKEAIELYEMIWDCELDVPEPLEPPRWNGRPPLELVPFGSWDAYALCIHAYSGEVWEYIPNNGLIRDRPNIRTVLEELIGVARSGETDIDFSWE